VIVVGSSDLSKDSTCEAAEGPHGCVREVELTFPVLITERDVSSGTCATVAEVANRLI
jgi:hypothetical protein